MCQLIFFRLKRNKTKREKAGILLNPVMLSTMEESYEEHIHTYRVSNTETKHTLRSKDDSSLHPNHCLSNKETNNFYNDIQTPSEETLTYITFISGDFYPKIGCKFLWKILILVLEMKWERFSRLPLRKWLVFYSSIVFCIRNLMEYGRG